VTLLQLREKDISSQDYYRLAAKVKKTADKHHVPLIINDRLGRRRGMIAAFVTTAAAVAVYIVVPNPVFLFWWGMFVGFSLCGAGGILGAYYAELFPEHLRAYAGGFCWNMGRIGAVLAPYTIGYIGKIYGLQTGLALTCVVYLLGAAMLLFLPETLHRGQK